MHIIDIIVFLLFTGGVVAFGCSFFKKKGTSEEFTSAGRSELLGSTFLLKERTTEGHDSAGKQQKDDYINDMHTDRAFKVSTPDKKGVPPTPCVSSRVPEH